jgi:glycosyltransferase involved in cell wall biosynthesis
MERLSLTFKCAKSTVGLPGWTCLHVGGPQRKTESEYFDSLRTETDRLGIADRLRFLGERKDVAQLLRAADIFCQTNLIAEPFGIVFI